MSALTFEVYQAGDGYRWRAKGLNGEVVFTGESHRRRSNAHRAIHTQWPDAITDIDTVTPVDTE